VRERVQKLAGKQALHFKGRAKRLERTCQQAARLRGVGERMYGEIKAVPAETFKCP